MASALEYLDNDATQQTRLFIQMIDKFFDCLNAKGPQMAKLKRKDDIAPYSRASDERVRTRRYYMMLIPFMLIVSLLTSSGSVMVLVLSHLTQLLNNKVCQPCQMGNPQHPSTNPPKDTSVPTTIIIAYM